MTETEVQSGAHAHAVAHLYRQDQTAILVEVPFCRAFLTGYSVLTVTWCAWKYGRSFLADIVRARESFSRSLSTGNGAALRISAAWDRTQLRYGSAD